MKHQLQSTIRGGETRVNAVGVDDLFHLYSRTGFLYPAKMQKLAPYFPLIRENWRKALQAGERILLIFSHHGEQGDAAASVSMWRSSNRGWLSQHLVSESTSPLSTRSILLKAQRTKIECQEDDSLQNWFRPENRYPARVFGSIPATLGSEYAAVRSYSLFTIGRKTSFPQSVFPTRIAKYDATHAASLQWLASQSDGSVFVRAEELASDPELKLAGEIYSSIGLHRSRSIWIAYDHNTSEPAAAILAYRGPLGMNFSFLENRCHLLLNPYRSNQAVINAALPLLQCARSAYENFEMDAIPVIAPAQHSAAFANAGLDFVRNYNQSIWVREGFEAWYGHVDRFYARLVSRLERHSAEGQIA